jgi:exodeoxyribonuclease V alpha subunit
VARLDTVEGVIERVTFRNDDTMYTVARVTCRDGREITAVGSMPTAVVGQAVRIHGTWVSHKTYGKQLKVEQVETIAPATLVGIEKYLGSGLIKGIGPATARSLVKAFGLDTLAVIEQRPEALLSVAGVGPKKAERIRRAVEEHRAVQQVMVFLQSHGVSPAYAARIFRRYGDRSIDVVSRNPYQLADDVPGIGFRTADKIAREVGIAPDSPHRAASAVKYWLSRCADDGHCYQPRADVVAAVAQELKVDAARVEDAIEALKGQGHVFVEDDAVYLAPFFHAERGVSARLTELAHARMWQLDKVDSESLDAVQASAGIRLGRAQREAIERAFVSGVMVLTGGPGTGKTTTLRVLMDLLEARKMKVQLAAPTGRAAKRMAEATGRRSRTIHRLLEFEPGEEGWRFGRGPSNPLECDAVVVDEVSMIDIILMYNLLKAIKPGCRLLLVGDADQLPSVGAGNVLRDIIASGVVPVVNLDEVFRQAAGSMIVTNAHRINRGEFPEFRGAQDFVFVEEPDPERAAAAVVNMVAQRLPCRLQCDPVDDIQVLSPMRRSLTGVDNLNVLLREALNPPRAGAPELRGGGGAFRRGDKVMQVRNNYERRVWNGDVGRVVWVDPEECQIRVRFSDPEGDRDVIYDQGDLDELVMAYCVSVHKSQGSEYAAIVVPVSTQHFVMLQRNLIYTAVTRAKRMVVMVGTKKALAIAIRRAEVGQRRTRLARRLQEADAEKG